MYLHDYIIVMKLLLKNIIDVENSIENSYLGGL